MDGKKGRKGKGRRWYVCRRGLGRDMLREEKEPGMQVRGLQLALACAMTSEVNYTVNHLQTSSKVKVKT